jgi:hypothetical protein
MRPFASCALLSCFFACAQDPLIPGERFVEPTPISAVDLCENPPACDLTSQFCPCAQVPSFNLEQVNPQAERAGETFGLDAYAGKVLLGSFYKSNCSLCEQQLGYLEVMQRQLTDAGYAVQMFVVIQAPLEGHMEQHIADRVTLWERRPATVCEPPASSPYCDENREIAVNIPMFQDTLGAKVWEDGFSSRKDDFFVYRPDGKLFRFFGARDRPENERYEPAVLLANRASFLLLKQTLVDASYANTANSEGGCSAQAPCGDNLWCQYEVGTCGEGGVKGVCMPPLATGVDGLTRCSADLLPASVCGCNGVTYENRCLAASEGESLWQTGHCSE